MCQVLKSALIEFAEIAKGNYAADDLQRAKYTKYIYYIQNMVAYFFLLFLLLETN